jgi:hypothetical protein
LQHRDREMRRRAETEQANSIAGLYTSNAQAAKANDAGAEQRRSVQVVEGVREGKNEILAGEG